MVGISGFETGALVAGRYRVVERLTRFAVADRAVSGVEFEYWLAVDEVRGAEVWLQAAVCESRTADGAQIAGAVAAIRRINHPAVPAVLDFGEIEVPVLLEDDTADLEVAEIDVEEVDVVEIEDAVEDVEIYRDVTRIGYTVLAPVEGESLAVALLRGSLNEAEILLVLAEVAEVLELLHETELVHGHLSAYSLVLTESGVLLLDLAVALAVEAASDSELTIAADVYALAWLACVLLVGIEVIEAEFGEGFLASESGALALEGLSLELVARRRRWAEVNLVERYGISAGLAALLIAGLSEASARPAVGGLTAAFRGRPIPASTAPRHAASAAGAAGAVGVAAAVTGAIFVGAVAEAGGVGGAGGASGQLVSETVAEQRESRQAQAGLAAAGGVGVAAAGFGVAAALEMESGSGSAATAMGGTTGAASTTGMASATGSVGVGAGASVAGASSGGGSAGAQTAVIPRVIAPAAAPAAQFGQSGIAGNSRQVRRRRTGVTVAFGIGLALILVLVLIWALFGRSKSAAPRPAANATSTSGLVGASAGAGAATTAPAGPVVVLPSAQAPTTAPANLVTITPGESPTTQAGRPTTPVSPLATIPGSPKLAVQQMQQLVNQYSGSLSPATLGQLNSILGTLWQEVGSGSSTQTESAALTQVTNQTGFPAGLAGQISQLIPYLTNFGGS